MNVQSINIIYQSYIATCIAQTGGRPLAAQLPQNLSDFTVAPHVAAEDMKSFNEKDKPQKRFFSLLATFVITELYYIHHVNPATIVYILIQLSFSDIFSATTYSSLVLWLYYVNAECCASVLKRKHHLNG